MAGTDRKRRKKRLRVEDDSSDSSSDELNDVDMADGANGSNSADRVDNDEPSSLGETSESEGSASDSDSGEEENSQNGKLAATLESGREYRRKVPAANGEDFQQYFLQLVTQQFDEDLEKLRKANDFGEQSLPQLIAALKNGVNIFTEDQKTILLQDKSN